MAATFLRLGAITIALALATAACSGDRTTGTRTTLSVTCAEDTGAESPCTRISFGAVPLGTSVKRSVTVRAVGQVPVDFSSADWASPVPEFFARGAPTSVTPGADVTFDVRFTPVAAGARTATFRITPATDELAPLEIIVEATGVTDPKARVEPASLDFGNVRAGSPETRKVTLANDDDVALVVTATRVSVGAEEFAAGSPDVATIAPGGTAKVSFEYAPANTGKDTATGYVAVRRSDTPSAEPRTFEVALTGRSVPQLGVAPASLDFGTATLGSHAQQIVTLSNTGAAPLELGTITLDPAAGPFSLVTPVPGGLTVAPGGSTALIVAYDPASQAAAAPDAASARIASNDPDHPSVVVSINGSCADCAVPDCAAKRTCRCGVRESCVASGCIEARRVFVSEAAGSAALGGLPGADARCQGYADAARLGGTWKAFVGDSTSAPATRFAWAAVPYALLDGTIVANDAVGLQSGTLRAAIGVDECGQQVGNAEVWTGLSSASATSGSGCADFTSDTVGATYANVGLTGATDRRWYATYLQYCDRTNVHLYCVEQ